MIVFPTFHDGGTMIDDAVAAAHKWMPDEPVLVVDSASPDRSYMDRVGDGMTLIADVGNVNYCVGAYWAAYEAFPDEDFYYLFHDSLMIRDDLTDLRDRECTAVRWWPAARDHGWGWDRDGNELCEWGQSEWELFVRARFPETFQGCFGPMVALSREVMDELYALDFDLIKAADKWQACAQERLWGAALNVLGHDLADGALQGPMVGFHDPYPTERVEKLHGDRY